jgi:hypothetical protein
MKAIVVKPNESPVVVDKDWSLEELQKAVGGMVESIPHTLEGVSVYGNDEAKILGLEFNAIGSLLCSPKLSEGDSVSGPVVIIGFDQATGESEEVSEYTQRLVFFFERVARHFEFMVTES